MIYTHLAIPDDLVQQTRPDGLARVDGHDRAPPILVAEKMMAAFDAENAEAGLSERRNQFGARDPRSATHAAMVTL